MGAWGTTLYANDTTNDLRGDYIDLLKRGNTNKEATQKIIEENQDIMGDIEEEPLFWFALADTQWDYGRLLPEVKEKALFFLVQNKETDRWKEAGQKRLVEWEETLCILKHKLESPQPAEKRVSKYRLYACKWKLGDVFAYQFTSEYSAEKGLKGKFVVFRKVSEDFWWPGHIVPIIQVYNQLYDTLPSIDTLNSLELLVIAFPKADSTEIKLLSESEKGIPKANLTYLGNIPGDDLIPYRGKDYWTGYYPVGWETSKYNVKFEHCIIDKFD